MLPIVITSLVLERMRSTWEIIPLKWIEEWEHHLEIRLLVVLSLTLQIILITLGSCRKKTSHRLLRIIMWCTYLSADALAMFAVGVIRIQPSLKSRNSRSSNNIAIDPNTELRAFWAPFLLMHLGGPDAITAYALEDNELWLRHCLSLVCQVVLTLYILFLSWTGSYISWLFVVIFNCGLIKYSERIWALHAASKETFRESMPGQLWIPKLQEEQTLKEAEGHLAVPHKVVELQEALDYDDDLDWKHEDENLREILLATRLFDIFRPAFTDQLLREDDAESSKSTLKDKNRRSVFNIIAIELGFIYDLLYTKAMLFQTLCGVVSRIVTLCLTTITLVVFTFISTSLSRKNASIYTKMDLHITLVLVVAAFFLELYAFLFQHLFSDTFICWLLTHKYTRILRIINRLRPLSSKKRWSCQIRQFSLLSYSLKEKHSLFLCRQEIPWIQKHFYLELCDVEDRFMDHLYDHIKTMPTLMYTNIQSLWVKKWKDNQQLETFKWLFSTELELELSILIWHIATDICYHFRPSDLSEVDNVAAEVGLKLSRYMMHLLVMYPSLLPSGVGRIKFKDMHSMMTTFFKNHRFAKAQEAGNHFLAKIGLMQKTSIEDACDLLHEQVITQFNLTVSSMDKSKFVMFNGCKLASQLREVVKDTHFRFELLRETWTGLLVLVALKSKANFHLQQLRRGGELITHVWLLLVHFGLTDHFKIPKNEEIAEMFIK